MLISYTFDKINYYNYIFNIPTNAHNIYTLKSTKIHIKYTQQMSLNVSVSLKSY
jgi:hypothetical protein